MASLKCQMSNEANLVCFQVCGGGDHVAIPCYNAPNWIVNGTSAAYKNLGCSDIDEIDPVRQDNLCGLLLGFYDEDYEGMPVSEACCACGGGQGENITHYLLGGGDIEEKEPECINEPGWFYATTQNGVKMGCDAIAANPDELCAVAESVDTLGKRKPASLACCVSFFNIRFFIIHFDNSLTRLSFLVRFAAVEVTKLWHPALFHPRFHR